MTLDDLPHQQLTVVMMTCLLLAEASHIGNGKHAKSPRRCMMSADDLLMRADNLLMSADCS